MSTVTIHRKRERAVYFHKGQYTTNSIVEVVEPERTRKKEHPYSKKRKNTHFSRSRRITSRETTAMKSSVAGRKVKTRRCIDTSTVGTTIQLESEIIGS